MAAMDEEKEGKQEEKAIVADVCFFVLVLLPRSQIVRGSFPGTPRS